MDFKRARVEEEEKPAILSIGETVTSPPLKQPAISSILDTPAASDVDDDDTIGTSSNRSRDDVVVAAAIFVPKPMPQHSTQDSTQAMEEDGNENEAPPAPQVDEEEEEEEEDILGFSIHNAAPAAPAAPVPAPAPAPAPKRSPTPTPPKPMSQVEQNIRYRARFLPSDFIVHGGQHKKMPMVLVQDINILSPITQTELRQSPELFCDGVLVDGLYMQITPQGKSMKLMTVALSCRRLFEDRDQWPKCYKNVKPNTLLAQAMQEAELMFQRAVDRLAEEQREREAEEREASELKPTIAWTSSASAEEAATAADTKEEKEEKKVRPIVFCVGLKLKFKARHMPDWQVRTVHEVMTTTQDAEAAGFRVKLDNDWYVLGEDMMVAEDGRTSQPWAYSFTDLVSAGSRFELGKSQQDTQTARDMRHGVQALASFHQQAQEQFPDFAGELVRGNQTVFKAEE